MLTWLNSSSLDSNKASARWIRLPKPIKSLNTAITDTDISTKLVEVLRLAVLLSGSFNFSKINPLLPCFPYCTPTPHHLFSRTQERNKSSQLLLLHSLWNLSSHFTNYLLERFLVYWVQLMLVYEEGHYI